MKRSSHRAALSSSLPQFDRAHVLHPYASLHGRGEPLPVVAAADGARLRLAEGQTLVDGLSSWWACVHGYAVPELERALGRGDDREDRLNHVMFGGLAHRPAGELVARILDLVPEDEKRKLKRVFLCDGGSVAVEVAMKIAMQYWDSRYEGKGVKKDKFLTAKSGYHGDTFGTMSVSGSGMHDLFRGAIMDQRFAEAPACHENQCTQDECRCPGLEEMRRIMDTDPRVGCVIIEPMFQGAGAMRFYSAGYLKGLRQACDERGLLLILDEIATGFGRTGEMFACEHAGVVPDIMCIGKALTGGYLSMGATIVSEFVAQRVDTPLMHGPTFMANPLTCTVACASIDLLCSSPWRERAKNVERRLRAGLKDVLPRRADVVADVRVFGAIGVVEFHEPLNVEAKALATKELLRHGVWLRPFANFLYTMPPFNCVDLQDQDLDLICKAMVAVVDALSEAKRAKKLKLAVEDRDDVTYV